jgi:hypothetical protein
MTNTIRIGVIIAISVAGVSVCKFKAYQGLAAKMCHHIMPHHHVHQINHLIKPRPSAICATK